ncbi:hypothetical protein [Amycolatopsis magusensis]|uniref:hypothetical protein n=1 Tax=Amycolatopsis magusensis TaxID=882444 RepID=UPI0024A8E078|nr:hypothetical protein [Amycolatopsis magusensis]MDI5980670.1 hypothetical protein [Amycolatopsis magusensis]
MKNLKSRLAFVAFTAGLALIGTSGVALAATAGPAAAQEQVAEAAVAYMGSTRDLAVCHSAGLWHITHGSGTYYYCQEYYDPATGRWYALYVGS